jgi:hypothetical protein
MGFKHVDSLNDFCTHQERVENNEITEPQVKSDVKHKSNESHSSKLTYAQAVRKAHPPVNVENEIRGLSPLSHS